MPTVLQTIQQGQMIMMTYVDGNLSWTLLHRPYVAISHVWADGLGNLSENAMPACQLAFLQRAVNEANGTQSSLVTPFWIDTLCVPVNDDIARRVAINRMASVYHDAEAVLVVDSSLLAQAQPRRPQETWLAIAQSIWQHRLWTYQESCLATTLKFMFQDGLFTARAIDWTQGPNALSGNASLREMRAVTWATNLEKGHIQLDRSTAPFQFDCERNNAMHIYCARKLVACAKLHERLCSGDWPKLPADDEEFVRVSYEQCKRLIAWLARFHSTQAPMIAAKNVLMEHSALARRPANEGVRYHWFSLFLKALSWRSTSRPEDEGICLATLLSIDVLPLLDMPSEDRIKFLLIDVQYLPKNFMLFTGPRDERDGCRWVPRSFLLPQHPCVQMGHADRVVANHFMTMNFTGISAQPEKDWARATTEGLRFQAKGALFDTASILSTLHSPTDGMFFSSGGDTYLLVMVEGPQLRRVAFEWQRMSDQQIGIIAYEGTDIPHAVGAVLCSLKPDRGDGLLRARYEHLCLIVKVSYSTSFKAGVFADWSISWSDEDKKSAVDVVELHEEQEWLLS